MGSPQIEFWRASFQGEALPGSNDAGSFGSDAFEKLARRLHVRVSGAPVGGQLALDRFLQDGLLEQRHSWRSLFSSRMKRMVSLML